MQKKSGNALAGPLVVMLHKGGGASCRPPFVDSLMRRVLWQGKTNSAEPRQSKPGSRAKSAGPKVGLRPARWLGQQVWCSRPGRGFFPARTTIPVEQVAIFIAFVTFRSILAPNLARSSNLAWPSLSGCVSQSVNARRPGEPGRSRFLGEPGGRKSPHSLPITLESGKNP